jgi:D-3-phosphoglycerate dehydrogenase / 2-oxoglutarate reductase
MSNWKILVTDGLDASGLEALRASAQVDDRNNVSPDDLLKVVAEYDALVVRGRTKVNMAVLEAAKNLKVVGRAGVGVDNIDLNAAKALGVIVVNAPIATTLAVAELTFGLMLALTREIPRADAAMKNGQWLKKELEGMELYGKTLGIVGMGHIGAEVGKRAAAFGMSVLGYDPLIAADEITRRGAEPVSLDTLYARADFITLHLPLTADTRNMINADAFAKMKNGVRIVCAARGGIIDEAALLDALNEGNVAGAALDVFATEPPSKTDLVSHSRMIATPHIGAQTVEAQVRAADDIAAEVLAALKGESLRWRVA